VEYSSVESVLNDVRNYASLRDGGLVVHDPEELRQRFVDRLAFSAVFGTDDIQAVARWLIWELSQELGCPSASIHHYYLAGGEGRWSNRTTPAINVRGMTYDVARSIVRTGQKLDAGQFIFEIARSEIGYTDQRPAEYASVVLAAALREGYQGPVFIQGDHFQILGGKYREDPDKEVDTVQKLALEGIEGGFYNIDVDASTIVDLSLDGEYAQQEANAARTADITAFIRQHEPAGVTVSVGGEIGEVGRQNSTVPELRAYMDQFRKFAAGRGAGISKISVQTGTSHGGVVLPDGTVADVAVDLDTLAELSQIAREEYGLSGAVQHGASTLPETMFDRFAQANASEVHLATGFQNIIFDSPALPQELRQAVYAWLAENRASERKEGQTDAQFYYTTRKRGFGPFKREFWTLDAEAKAGIIGELENRFELIFSRLGVAGSATLVREVTPLARVRRPAPEAIRRLAVSAD
jgi:fructose/tagatose bisphosphate aldolase